MTTARCKSCDALIVWAISPAGRSLPIDALPMMLSQLPDRAVAYSIAHDKPKVQLALYQQSLGPDELSAYVSHFVTCPNASSHSRKVTA